MKSITKTVVTASALLLLAGCASVPTGPSVMALPGTGRSFEQFRMHDVECRRHALHQIGGADANQAATDAGVRSAVVGTAVGAVAGAAIGGRDAAGVGAGTGLLVGSIAGTGAAQSSGWASQGHYDNAYIQCMYAKGERVPVPADVARRHAQQSVNRAGVPPAAAYPPPPPPGYGSPPQGYPPPPSLPAR